MKGPFFRYAIPELQIQRAIAHHLLNVHERLTPRNTLLMQGDTERNERKFAQPVLLVLFGATPRDGFLTRIYIIGAFPA